MWKKSKTKMWPIILKSLWIRTTWHLDNRWDVLKAAFWNLVLFYFWPWFSKIYKKFHLQKMLIKFTKNNKFIKILKIFPISFKISPLKKNKCFYFLFLIEDNSSVLWCFVTSLDSWSSTNSTTISSLNLSRKSVMI